MGIFKESNLTALKDHHPLNIEELMNDAEHFERKCYIDEKNLAKSKENLMDAKGLLEVMLSNLLTHLRNTQYLKTAAERAVFMKMVEDISRCLGILDRREKDLMTGIGESDVGITHLSAFRKELMKTYFALIINPLKKVKEIYYKEISNNEKVQDKERALFLVTYELLSVIASSLYSQQRVSAAGMSSSSGLKGIERVPSWQTLYVKSILKEKNQANKENDGNYDLRDLEDLEDSEIEEDVEMDN